jgi:dihydroorotate dehydrogenase
VLYRMLFRTVFVPMDPERAHHLAMVAFRLINALPPAQWVLRKMLRVPVGQVSVFGRDVPGHLGVAAGFDKNAEAVPALIALGFSHVEVGTVTAFPQPGNERPRLWRLVEQRCLRNRMGFNNDGAQVVARRLARLRASSVGRSAVIGVNIGKTKATPPDRAAADYATSAALLGPYADYVVVNVSSPNTPGLRDLQSVSLLRPILTETLGALRSACDVPPPLLVKIAPDLADDDIDAVADLVAELDLAGVVAINTTIDHDLGPGGLSGPVLLPRGVDVVSRLRERLGPDRTIIGVGGIETAADAGAYLAAGADLVQGFTAFIYIGPFWAARINRALAG